MRASLLAVATTTTFFGARESSASSQAPIGARSRLIRSTAALAPWNRILHRYPVDFERLCQLFSEARSGESGESGDTAIALWWHDVHGLCPNTFHELRSVPSTDPQFLQSSSRPQFGCICPLGKFDVLNSARMRLTPSSTRISEESHSAEVV